MEAQTIAGRAVQGTASRRLAAVSIRLLDLAFAFTLSLLLAPAMLAVAIAIRLESPGPAIFRQRRLGRDGREFTVRKFRTMHLEADESVHRDYVRGLIAGNGERVSDGRRSLYKLAVDNRITRLGRVLRKWSIDELPQLWNVLHGDMSLVGPRPVIAYEMHRYPRWYHERFAVKPGLTGLWQVAGRNELSYEDMVRLDIEYARRWGLALYLSILLRTAWVVLTHRGAA